MYTLVYRLESVNFGHAEVVTWISYVQSRARIGNHSNLYLEVEEHIKFRGNPNPIIIIKISFLN